MWLVLLAFERNKSTRTTSSVQTKKERPYALKKGTPPYAPKVLSSLPEAALEELLVSETDTDICSEEAVEPFPPPPPPLKRRPRLPTLVVDSLPLESSSPSDELLGDERVGGEGVGGSSQQGQSNRQKYSPARSTSSGSRSTPRLHLTWASWFKMAVW